MKAALYIVGGLLLAGGIGYAVTRSKKSEEEKAEVPETVSAEAIMAAGESLGYKSPMETDQSITRIPSWHADYGTGNTGRILVTKAQFLQNLNAYIRLLAATKAWQDSVLKQSKEPGWPNSGMPFNEAAYVHLRDYTSGKYFYQG